MKRMLPVILALCAGCVSVPSSRDPGATPREPSPAEREAAQAVSESFHKLRTAFLEGDALGALTIMSVQGVSDWLFERTRDGDPEWPKSVAALDAARKVDLDHWIRSNKDVKPGFSNRRPHVLPESILTSKWLVETWKKIYAPEKDNLIALAQKMEVGEIWVDLTNASIFVKLGETPARIYSMVMENGQWKFDYRVRPATNRQ